MDLMMKNTELKKRDHLTQSSEDGGIGLTENLPKSEEISELVESSLLLYLNSSASNSSLIDNFLSYCRESNEITKKTFEFGRNYFHLAVISNNVRLVEILLDSEFAHDVYHQDDNGKNSLHVASNNRKILIEMQRLLILKAPWLVFQVDNLGNTPLHDALASGSKFKIRNLICLGNADLNLTNKAGVSPKSILVENNNFAGVNYFENYKKSLTKGRMQAEGVLREQISYQSIYTSSKQEDSIDVAQLALKFQRLRLEDSTLIKKTPNLCLSNSLLSNFISVPAMRKNSAENSAIDASEKVFKLTVRATSYPVEKEWHTLSRQDLLEIKYNKTLNYMNNGGNPDAVELYLFGKRPIRYFFAKTALMKEKATDDESGNDEIKKYQSFLHLFLNYSKLLDNTSATSTYIKNILHGEGAFSVLTDALHYMRPFVEIAYSHHLELIEKRHRSFEVMLFILGLGRVPFLPLIKKDYRKLAEQENLEARYFELFDAICAGLTSDGEEKKFNRIELNLIVIGLTNFISPTLMLRYLTTLMLHFDISQKLVANLLVYDLLVYDIHCELIANDDFVVQLNAFCEQNTFFYKEFKIFYEELIDKKKNFFAQCIVYNFQTLRQCFQSHPKISQLEDFDHIIKSAIHFENKKMKCAVDLVAAEISRLSVSIYQNLRVSEFINQGWSKDNKTKTSFNLLRDSHHTNCLIYYFVDIFLDLPISDMSRQYSLYLQISKKLRESSDNELFPNFNSFWMMCAVLGSNEIERLISLDKLNDKLSVTDRFLQTETNNLCTSESKYINLRHYMAGQIDNFPILPWKLTEIISCLESGGNLPFDIVSKANKMGKVFKTVLDSQQRVLFDFSPPVTNLPYLLDASFRNAQKYVSIKNDLSFLDAFPSMIREYTCAINDDDLVNILDTKYRKISNVLKPFNLDNFGSVQTLFPRLKSIVEFKCLPEVIIYKNEKINKSIFLNALNIIFIKQLEIFNKTNDQKQQLYLEMQQYLRDIERIFFENKFVISGDKLPKLLLKLPVLDLDMIDHVDKFMLFLNENYSNCDLSYVEVIKTKQKLTNSMEAMISTFVELNANVEPMKADENHKAMEVWIGRAYSYSVSMPNLAELKRLKLLMLLNRRTDILFNDNPKEGGIYTPAYYANPIREISIHDSSLQNIESIKTKFDRH